MTDTAQSRPRMGKIPEATAYSGISRTSLYLWARDNPGLFVKSGASTLVDFSKLDEILDRLPPAKIGGRTDK
jgi:hypothetical protein